MKLFKNVKGETIDLIRYIHYQLNKYPTVEIHVGTDSQDHGAFVTYVTVVAFKYGTRGVHYIYNKQNINSKQVKDLWTRLWKETERTIEVAQLINNNLNVILQIDMDYNSNEIHESNKLISAARGWAMSLGYAVNVKPFKQIATKAADYHCGK